MTWAAMLPGKKKKKKKDKVKQCMILSTSKVNNHVNNSCCKDHASET